MWREKTEDVNLPQVTKLLSDKARIQNKSEH